MLNEKGRPICCEMWLGKTADVKTLISEVDRLSARFHISSICIVADRGMISAEVLRTNTRLPAAEVALKYKELWRGKYIFRSVKSILETQPIYHRCDETIRGHVFCSFLALVVMKELQARM